MSLALRRSLVLLLACLIVTACSWSAEPGEKASAPVVPLRPGELEEFWADYDTRNNRAMRRALSEPHDARAWSAVDAGILLRADRYDTRYAELSSHDEAHRHHHRPGLLYTTAFAADPMRVLVTSTVSSPGDRPSGRPSVTLSAFVRESSGAPWLRTESAAISPSVDLPEPLPPEDAVVSEDHARHIDRLTDRLARFWRRGTRPTVLELDSSTLRARRRVVAEAKGFRFDIAARRYLPRQTGWGVGVRGGVLALRNLMLTIRYLADPGIRVSWRDKAQRVLRGDTGDEVRYSQILTAAIFVPDDGSTARVLGTTAHEVVDLPSPPG